MTESAMVHLAGVTKRIHRPGQAPRVLVEKVSLAVPEGCLYGLIGPGGSGKSVVLKLMTGLMTPDEGTAQIGDKVLTGASQLAVQDVQKGIGMLFQNNALFQHLTVFENIAFPLRRLGALDEGEIEERVKERLACVSLAGYGERMPDQLSGGQKKRVGFARATVGRAPVVLYDEPAAGLDPVTSQKIFDLLRAEQQASKATAVVVSSDLDRLLPIADRVGFMHRGTLVFDGTAAEARASTEPHVRQFVHGLVDGPL